MGKREFKYTLNKSHLKAIFALCLFIFSAHSLAAQNRWWVAIDDGTDKYWDDNANSIWIIFSTELSYNLIIMIDIFQELNQ